MANPVAPYEGGQRIYPLDVALAEVEAALPDGWVFADLNRRDREDFYGHSYLEDQWEATALKPFGPRGFGLPGIEYHDGASGYGDTPTDAMRDLVAKLRDR